MKKVIILGAGPLQIPAIIKIKELGFYLYAFDYDENAEGFKYCDEHFIISTIDKENVLKKAKELKPDYILTSTSDAPVQTVAYVCEKLGLPTGISYNDAICATEKWAMRDRLKANNVPIPYYCSCKNYNEFYNSIKNLKFNCVVKPSDSAASRGVQLISSDKDLKKIYDNLLKYSRNGIVMVEEFMSGPEVSVECLITDKNVNIINITDKLVTKLPYFVELGHSEPSMLSNEIKNEIVSVTKQAINAINIISGVAHVEIKITPDGVKIVELAARLGGDYITSMLVPLSTGYDLVGNSIKLSLGLEIDPINLEKKGSAIRFICAKKGIIKNIYIDEAIKTINNIVEVKLYKKIGDKVDDVRSSNDRLGHIIARGKNAEEAVKSCEDALKLIHVVTVD